MTTPDWDLIEMSDDNILLRSIMADHEITARRLANETGRAEITIYKYMEREITCPSLIWRTLYRLTRDHRIPELMTGSVPVVLIERPEAAGCDAVTLASLIAARQATLTCEQDFLEIIADGKIDQADRAAIAGFKSHFPLMIQQLYRIYLSIENEFERV